MSDGDNEHWYVINYMGADQYLSDGEIGAAPGNVAPIVKKENLWKFTGTKDNLQIISNSGKYIAIADGAVALSNEPYAAGFKLVETNYNTNHYFRNSRFIVKY